MTTKRPPTKYPGDDCDDCGAPEATDYGHTVLCDDCANDAVHGFEPTDHKDRMTERAAMGFCDF